MEYKKCQHGRHNVFCTECTYGPIREESEDRIPMDVGRFIEINKVFTDIGYDNRYR